MSEVLERYQGLAAEFGQRVEATPDDRWSTPSPSCPGWTARDIVAHVVDGQRYVVAAIQGIEPEPVPDDADPKELFQASNAALQAAAAQPEALVKPVKSPMGELPAELILGRIMSMDVLVHTWDLARAVGGDEHLDQDAVAHAFEGIRPVGPMLRRPGFFGDEVEAPEGADLQTQFLNFLGRRP
ncbi:MAG TPA: TIGR03086 family metal-binding protein [Acidimicrobiales bacterium]|nr:TIGR03086 family metal-binding protein [Acidimicrobiales bacterium]